MGVAVYLSAFPGVAVRDVKPALFVLVVFRFTLGKQLPTSSDVSAER